MSKNKFHCLVVDTTAFINNVALQEHAEYLITVPEVVKEIKNKRQLKRLCVLPYDLVIDEPSPDAVKHVIAFAKKTGDYLSLSSADLKVIALTYQLECELVGKDHLRTEPVVSKTIASKQKPVELIDKNPLAGFYVPPQKEKVEEKTRQNRELVADKVEQEEKEARENGEEEGDDSETEDQGETTNNFTDPLDKLKTGKTVEELKEKFNKLNCGLVSESEADQILVSVKNESKKDEDNFLIEESETDSEEEEEDDDEEDDESSWITPSNLEEMKSACGKDIIDDEKQARVACMSTDYAVQNVLKQINLNIAALDGRIIKQMRTYILRCYACFKTTSIMTKLFCPNCGHKTLKRVAVSIDENGQQVIHINLRRPLTAKGKNQSIPKPRGGKHSSNPILFEDQPIPKQFPSRVARTKTNAMDEDYIAGFSPFVLRDVDSKSALLRAKNGGNIKQWARNHAYRNTKRNSKK
ncbi:RNA-binding protein NOB1 [Sitodiplosis mosellana]|uniref:RNA-binding protein NOB1 n=1 Tax=Sitodiplosis mosellana TaxID=263140 RepID=UPI002444A6EF|nr:RNA-binding protein NOB1 [Sitodiplosis mosellana]